MTSDTERAILLAVTPEERFWQKVEKSDDCWLWTGSKKNQYGGFWFRQKIMATHRVSYLLHYGEIPEGYHIHHECGNKLCVRPDHLKALTLIEHSRLGNKGRYPGVFWSSPNRWRADIVIDGKKFHLGVCDTEEEAYELRLKALEKEGR